MTQPLPYGPPTQQVPPGWQQQPYGPPPGWQPPLPPPKKRGGGLALAVAASVVAVLAVFGGIVALTDGETTTTATQEASSTAETKKAKSSKKPTPKPASTRMTRTDREALFVATVKQQDALRNADPEDLVKLGREMCKALDDGYTLTQVATSGVEQFGLETSAFVAGAAIVGLCPRHKGKIPD
ncbi:DUF732 domain-containing protein [Planomonospora venezuelensis]|uniref:DUF732 domain-containing protein n=1 Tax=Planomonospora venezuelensis TaxID=1999 RepID=A0A841D317_PLAVE|nr:DUF732 domain-containing protein [Planomonospora venezuelensis]MBB5965062.1 hypothetical protein [Planomonospora venezuelensis]